MGQHVTTEFNLPDGNGGYNTMHFTGHRHRRDSTAYAVGDIAYSVNLPSWARLECVTAGVTGATEPSFTGVTAGGTYITDGTVTWIITDIRDGHSVGEVFFDSILRPGCIRANGAAIANASVEIPRILKHVQDNPALLAADATAYAANVGKYLYDSATDTLTLPNYVGRVMQGGATVQSIEAGLPNIEGTFAFKLFSGAGLHVATTLPTAIATKSFSQIASVSTRSYFTSSGTTESGEIPTQINFNASSFNSIYGNSTTVQPPAITAIPQMKY